MSDEASKKIYTLARTLPFTDLSTRRLLINYFFNSKSLITIHLFEYVTVMKITGKLSGWMKGALELNHSTFNELLKTKVLSQFIKKSPSFNY